MTRRTWSHRSPVGCSGGPCGRPFIGTSSGRIADGPQDPGPQILLPAYVVDQLALERVEEHAVDGEVAPQRILARRGKHHLVGAPAVRVALVGAEGGDLNLHDLTVRPPRPE